MSEADGRNQRPRVTVFCSTAENIGQTTTLLNTAVLLARSGRRVLVLDARNADARTRYYVRSVTPGPALLADSEGGPTVEEWSPAGAVRPIGIVTLKGHDALTALPAPRSPVFGAYDDILVDAPLIRTDQQAADLARLPSVLVMCFTAASSFIESAVALAERLRGHADRPFDVLALALQTDAAHEDQLRLARDRARERFAPLGGDRAARYLEIPYHALSERSPRLGMELEPGNGFAERVRPALERLVAALSRPRFTRPARALLVCAPRHAVWAEWIEDRLRGSGTEVVRRSYGDWAPEPPGEDEVLLLLPPAAPGPEDRQALRALSDPGVRMVLVDDEALPREFAHHQRVDLRRLPEQRAAERLLRGLDLPAGNARPSRGRRFPSLPNSTNLVARNVAFVGRDALLGEVRSAVAELAREHRPCLVLGTPGIGKSELLLEFCHRFGGSYDVVWWLTADDRGEVLSGLTALGNALGEPSVQDAAAHVRGLRSRADALGERWLLVCDEVDEPVTAEEVARLLPEPSEHCHVLIGARGTAEEAARSAVEVPPFTRAESEALVTTMVPGLTPLSARTVAQRVGPLPLALWLAACWLGVAAERAQAANQSGAPALLGAVDEFSRTFDQRRQAHGAGPMSSVEVLLHLARASLLKTPAAEAWGREPVGSRALLWLLESCALLAGAGTDLRLLHSRQLATALARGGADPSDGDPGGPAVPVRSGDQLLIDASLWAMNRHGLLDFDFARPDQPVRQHRVLRDLVVAGMDAADRDGREAELRAAIGETLLVTDRDRPTPAPQTIVRRGRQIDALRLWADSRPEVRQALLSHLSDLIVSQEKQHLQDARRLAELAEPYWEPDSFEGLRLRSMLSQTLRHLQVYGLSARMARSVLQSYRTRLGLGHPRALLMADGYAANLRTFGRFGDALDEGLHAARTMTRLLGPRHWTTEQMRRNLAWRYAVLGNCAEGLRILRLLYDHRRAVGGDEDPVVEGLVPELAEMHRLLGQNIESYQLLKRAGVLGGARPGIRRVPLVVQAENGLAVSERRLGDHERAQERDLRTLDMAAAMLGERSITTLRCRFSLAADHHVLGDHDSAVAESERCLEGLETSLGREHPFSDLCRVRLGVHLRGAGRLDEARDVGRAAQENLRRRLSDHHPWVLAAAASVANTLVELGELDEAVRLEEFARLGYDRTGFARHPDRAAVADNLAVTRARRLGAPPTGEEPRRRTDIDLELPDL
ncbi:FxSxx-COOH system tetratricopeptide repeat protein [Streptomyces sp. NPDC018610]|uniref:FxSxx-COOH system tetratricopeptide repeat protein n=1 Tax=Streptomyces sp. NPDC018610 TaxID=3365049 RepID=UPI0037B1CAF9